LKVSACGYCPPAWSINGAPSCSRLPCAAHPTLAVLLGSTATAVRVPRRLLVTALPLRGTPSGTAGVMLACAATVSTQRHVCVNWCGLHAVAAGRTAQGCPEAAVSLQQWQVWHWGPQKHISSLVKHCPGPLIVLPTAHVQQRALPCSRCVAVLNLAWVWRFTATSPGRHRQGDVTQCVRLCTATVVPTCC
jgi:hypothetical protein